MFFGFGCYLIRTYKPEKERKTEHDSGCQLRAAGLFPIYNSVQQFPLTSGFALGAI